MINRLCPKFSGGLGDVVSGREQLRCSTLPLTTSPRPPENFGQRLLIIPHLETVNLLWKMKREIKKLRTNFDVFHEEIWKTAIL